jgi:MSHA biogenesis protein MshP
MYLKRLMFPRKIVIRHSVSHLPIVQRGFLLPLTLFILVVMGALALTLSRTSIQGQSFAVQEVLSVQSFYAAESGVQRGMARLFFNATITRTAVDGRCNSWSQNFTFAGINGLKSCNTQVSCSLTTDAANTTSFYTITSVGTCGQDQFRAQRSIQAAAYLN